MLCDRTVPVRRGTSLLDLTLPDSQGLETLQRVRGKDPATPIVILAQPGDRSNAVHALDKGAQDYLVKGQVDSYLLGQTILRRVPSKDFAPGDKMLRRQAAGSELGVRDSRTG